MSINNPKIDEYIEKAAAFAKPIMHHLRQLVHSACPEVEEAWKWSFPVFMYKGTILCNMAAFKQHCSFGFWKATLMVDPDGILATENREGMGQLGKIESVDNLPPDDILVKYIRAAMKLVDDGVKPPPKPRGTTPKEIIVPEYFIRALAQHEKAKAIFEAFPYSHKKEYIEWFEDAKTEPTRNKRIAQAIVWIEEGKQRNWKYAC